MPGSWKFSLYFHKNLSRHLLSLLDLYVKSSRVYPLSYKQREICRLGRRVPSTSGVTLQLRDASARDFTIRRWQGERQKQVKKARRLPLLQAQSSIWNRLSLLNNFLMFLHKFNEIFRVNWWRISDCRVSSFLKTFPGCRVSRHELFFNSALFLLLAGSGPKRSMPIEKLGSSALVSSIF